MQRFIDLYNQYVTEVYPCDRQILEEDLKTDAGKPFELKLCVYIDLLRSMIEFWLIPGVN